MSNLIWKIVTLVLLILIFVVGGYSYLKYSESSSPVPSPQASPNQSPKLTNHLLLIQNNQSNQFLVTEEGTIVKQLISLKQIGRDGTGRISPNLKYLAYNSLESSQAAQPQYGLKLRNIQTEEEFVIGKASDISYSYPYFSPNSKLVAYSTDTKTYLYNIDNKTSSVISSFSTHDSFLFSPDNKTLLITDGKLSYKYNLLTHTLLKFVPASFPSQLHSNFASISSDSKYLVLNQADGLYSMDWEGKNTQKIADFTSDTIQFGGISNNTHQAIFSKYIKSTPDAQAPSVGDKTYLYSYNLDTKELKQLLLGTSVNFRLTPEGDKIAFTDYLSDTNRGYFLLSLSTGKIDPFLGSLTERDPSKENNLELIDWQ